MSINIKLFSKETDELNRINVSAKVRGYMGYHFSANVWFADESFEQLVKYSCNCFEYKDNGELCVHCKELMTLCGASDLEVVLEESTNADSGEEIANGLEVEDVPENIDETYADVINEKVEDNQEDNIDLDFVDVECVEEEEPEHVESINIEMGDGEDGETLFWPLNDTTKVFNPNMGIIGTMGTGKTQFTKSIITQIHNADEKLGVLIFDYKGDYNIDHEDFVEACDAKVYLPYKLPYNPLNLPKSQSTRPLLPIHIANGFKDTISRIYRLGAKQQNALFECIIKAYRKFGILPNDRSTWNKVAPTFEDVYSVYLDDESIAKNDSLYAAMSKLHSFEIFEDEAGATTSLMDMIDGVTVIDLSGFDADIQNLVVAISLDQYYLQMYAKGASKIEGDYRQIRDFILVDEADNFMKEDFPTLKKILKEGREFGAGMILSTQFLKHFAGDGNDYSKYIFTWVVHNVSDFERKDVEFVFKLQNKSEELQNVYDSIKKLEKHHSIVKIGKEPQTSIEDLAFWKLLLREK